MFKNLSITRSSKLNSLFVLAALVTSCKPGTQNQSEEKTLENFAAQEVVKLNSCSGNQEINQVLKSKIMVEKKFCSGAVSATEKQLCDAVTTSLSAVPASLQSAFAAMGGSIVVMAKSKSACQQLFSQKNSSQYTPSADAQKIDGCFTFIDDQERKKKSVLAIVLPSSEQAIKHNIVRIFGFWFVQFVPYVNTAKAGDYRFDPTQSPPAELESFKEELAHNFFKDMYALEQRKAEYKQGSLYSINALEPLLGHKGASVVRKNLQANKRALEGLNFALQNESISPDKIALRKNRIMDFIFAESIDSAKCSAESLASAKENFPLVAQRFSDIDSVIQSRSKQIASGQSEKTVALVTKSSIKLTASDSDFMELLRAFMPALQAAASRSNVNSMASQYSPSVQNSGSQVIPTNNSVQDAIDGSTTVDDFAGQINADQLSQGQDQILGGCPNCNCNCSNGSCSCSGGTCNCSGGTCTSCSGCSGCQAMTSVG